MERIISRRAHALQLRRRTVRIRRCLASGRATTTRAGECRMFVETARKFAIVGTCPRPVKAASESARQSSAKALGWLLRGRARRCREHLPSFFEPAVDVGLAVREDAADDVVSDTCFQNRLAVGFYFGRRIRLASNTHRVRQVSCGGGVNDADAWHRCNLVDVLDAFRCFNQEDAE